MRGIRGAAGAVVVLGGLWALSGCIFSPGYDDCTQYPHAGCIGSGGGSSSSSSSGTGGTPITCVPSLDPKTAVDSSCGVFVSATGDDTAAGTKDRPVKTLKQAVMLSGTRSKTIYACAEELPGPVELPGGFSVYGGLDCTAAQRTWLYVGDKTKTTITSDAETIPLTITTTGSTKLADLHVLAKSAVNAGGSSIALAVSQATVEITRCLVESKDAQAGVSGDLFTDPAQAGMIGMIGGDACTANQVLGGDVVSSMCGMPDSISGTGGTGLQASGGDGSAGTPDGAMNGGKGEGVAACAAGLKGNDGLPGTSGSGATGVGSISQSGFIGGTGLPGASGAPAQGGGGGGGAKGGTGAGKCPMGTAGGAAGGSGGSGGCGGSGGKGGKPGGSSIAVLSIGATLSFTGTALITGMGGKGGDGGPGQDGGQPGDPGLGGNAMGFASLKSGCAGGPGGIGGKGGQGGGGTGGHSIAIAFLGTPPTKDGWTSMTGTPAAGGMGGDAMSGGAPGVKADMQEFK